jgi:hypothetical protein
MNVHVVSYSGSVRSSPPVEGHVRYRHAVAPGDRTEPFIRKSLAKYRLSDNAGAVKHFLSILLRALRRARHFALVEALAVAVALPTKASS